MTTTPPPQAQPRSFRMWGIALVATLILTGTGYCVWYFVANPSREKYGPIIAAIAAGQIEASADHPTDLPPNLHGITDRDQVLITRKPDGSFRVVFPTSHGAGIELVGLMYTSSPLSDEDTFPNQGAVEYSKLLIRCGSYGRLNIDSRIDDHWYHVSWGMKKGT
jgi:hypothetical protein